MQIPKITDEQINKLEEVKKKFILDNPVHIEKLKKQLDKKNIEPKDLDHLKIDLKKV